MLQNTFMQVIEHLERAKQTLISFEIVPPTRGSSLKKLTDFLERLIVHRPSFIDITNHAADIFYRGQTDHIKKVKVRKRPGTLGICSLIQHKYGIDAVPHVICRGSSKQETEDFLIDLQYLGIETVLAVQGDQKSGTWMDNPYQNRYAADLIRQISLMNKGNYLDSSLKPSPTHLCIGCAGYPEKHVESPNMDDCLQYTLEKVRAGASYIVAQMFFNNRHYFDFVRSARAIGIDVPIIPGLKILTTKKQLMIIPKIFHCEIPQDLALEMEKQDYDQSFHVGVEWAVGQVQELIEANVPCIHFYVMNKVDAVDEVLKNINL